MARQVVRRRKSQGFGELGRGLEEGRRRRQKVSSSSKNSFKACLQFIAISSVIPLLFFLRMTMHQDNNNDTAYLRSAPLSIPSSLPEPFAFLPELLRTYCTAIQKQHKSSSLLDHDLLLGSDVVELHHCRRAFVGNNNKPLDWHNFTAWANTTLQHVEQKLASREIVIQQELILELLEIYATHHGYCRFNEYRPSFDPPSQEVVAPLEQTELMEPPRNTDGSRQNTYARLAFVIAVDEDDNYSSDNVNQVQSLVQAIHMPHHYIILHVPAKASMELTEALEQIANQYDNVVVISFGATPSKTDSLSMIHWKIMRWLTRDIGLKYDYHITLDGTSFPLYSAEKLAQYLAQSSNSVWLGTLTENGAPVRMSNQKLFGKKQVTLTASRAHQTVSLGKSSQMFLGDGSRLPEFLAREEMNTQTTSGNLAVFSYDVITKLLDSPRVGELFALSKYGCCETLENYNWFMALNLVVATELRQEAKSLTSVFQLYGGDCQTALDAKNTAVLALDDSQCYRIEYPSLVESVYNKTTTRNNAAHDMTMPKDRTVLHGDNDTFTEYLKHAKKLGFLFARRFDGANLKSVAAREAIQATIWKYS